MNERSDCLKLANLVTFLKNPFMPTPESIWNALIHLSTNFQNLKTSKIRIFLLQARLLLIIDIDSIRLCLAVLQLVVQHRSDYIIDLSHNERAADHNMTTT